uniref:Uncharacterized protein n=1 Tax=Timema poppense TaxID=170557 RepID=A0A7R9D0K7_TIMPO|nr:unnamed protein product [Timema poppensis]
MLALSSLTVPAARHCWRSYPGTFINKRDNVPAVYKGTRGVVTSVLVVTFRAREVVAQLLAFLPDIRRSCSARPSKIYDVTNKNYTS